MQKQKKKLSLATKIFIAMVLGIAVGIAFIGKPDFTTDYLKPFGNIFINLLKFIVVPIVVLSIIDGIISMKDIRKVGAIGWKTVVYYLFTTAFAVVIGLAYANLFKNSFGAMEITDLEYTANSANFMDTIVNIFPSNLFAPMVNSTMLQVIVIAILIGVGILLAGEKGEVASKVNESFYAVFMKIMSIIIEVSPIGVFCMMVWVVANQGPQVLGSLAKVLLVAYLGYITHMVVVYSVTVGVIGGVSPIKFFKHMVPAMIFAFSSTSSVATLPITMECVENMGGKKDIASFVLPLGATINMDGTAIYMGVTSIFIATCYGISLTVPQMISIILTATLASVGTAGVAGAGMIMLAMVLESVNIPVAGIALIMGIDRLFDMGRTTLNIVGDASCAMILSSLEDKKAAKNGK